MIIFFYVLRDFFKYVTGIMALSLFLFVLFDFIHKSTRYLDKYNPSFEQLFFYYLYQLPGLVIQGLPIAALLASVITMVLLARTNEITAMRAAGMGPIRLAYPLLAGGIILSLISIVFGEVLLPRTSLLVHQLKKYEIENQNRDQQIDTVRWLKDGRILYNFGEFDIAKKRLKNVKILHVDEEFRLVQTTEASQAYYTTSNSWQLVNVTERHYWPDGTISYQENLVELETQIPLVPEDLRKEHRLPNERSSLELWQYIEESKQSGSDVLDLQVDLHVKFAFHFAALVVCLIGMKFAFRSERKMETARGVLLAIFIGVSYWFVLNAGRALGKRGTLSPFMAAWLANFVIFIPSLYSLIKSRKS